MTHPRDKAQKTEIEARRRQVASLLLAGISNHSQIAEQVGVSRPTIVRDVKVIENEWREEAKQDIAAARGRDLKRTERLIASHWSQATKGHLGSTDRVIKLMEYRSKLLGTPAPTRSEVTGRDGGPVQFEMSEQVRRLAEQYGTTEEEVLALASDTGGDE